MRTILDSSPLFRSTVGFDRMFELLDSLAQPAESWPPYDILKTGENAYRLEMAVAGFSENELDVTQDGNTLLVRGTKSNENSSEYLHRGIAGRAFTRRFELDEYVRVEDARLQNGLLVINLVRDLPEALKPRRIEISSKPAMANSGPRRIEQAA
jgi:molecular chaperone IbpA